MKNQPKRETLAKELESVAAGQGRDLSVIIAHARDDSFPDDKLVAELSQNKLKFFARKLILKQYDSI